MTEAIFVAEVRGGPYDGVEFGDPPWKDKLEVVVPTAQGMMLLRRSDIAWFWDFVEFVKPPPCDCEMCREEL